jgi:nanoRNase/pAp phosphatase (c-di-AMP/oligoRNAs hydrolase)
VPRTHDIAKLCERYGGGGHPAVGAISLPKTDLAAVLRVAAEITAFLQTG